MGLQCVFFPTPFLNAFVSSILIKCSLNQCYDFKKVTLVRIENENVWLLNVLLSGWGEELLGAAAAVVVTGVGVLGGFGGKSCWILCQASSLIISASSLSSSIPEHTHAAQKTTDDQILLALLEDSLVQAIVLCDHTYLHPHSLHLSCSWRGWLSYRAARSPWVRLQLLHLWQKNISTHELCFCNGHRCLVNVGAQVILLKCDLS